MPELPEVETTLRGIAPYLRNHHIESVVITQPQLRWPVSSELQTLTHLRVLSLRRRAKYLIIDTEHGNTDPGHIIIHLGMSGSLRIVNQDEPHRKHDHVEFRLSSGKLMRYHDPRRFGAVLWTATGVDEHVLIKKLGPEPLDDDFDSEYLHRATRKRKAAIKNLIMDSHVVVGVGNIYASESLFLAGVRPGLAAGRITRAQASGIVTAIKQVLSDAIDQGGTTLRDFVNSDGAPGYFQQTLNVYGRSGELCRQCKAQIKSKTIGQRSTFYCPDCQS